MYLCQVFLRHKLLFLWKPISSKYQSLLLIHYTLVKCSYKTIRFLLYYTLVAIYILLVYRAIKKSIVQGRESGHFNVSSMGVKSFNGIITFHVNVSWTPNANDIGKRIVCVTAVEDTGYCRCGWSRINWWQFNLLTKFSKNHL